MQVTVFIAISLDGFIAREDGSLDWLPSSDGDSESREDHGYYELMASVDVLAMGRNTFEKVLTFGQWPYGETPVIVLSSRSVNIPAELPDIVEGQHWSPNEVVTNLARRGYRHLYIDGGVTIQRFLQAGLVDELIITRIPVLIGRGLPLFGTLDQDIMLEHVETKSYPSGMVQSRYLIA